MASQMIMQHGFYLSLYLCQEGMGMTADKQFVDTGRVEPTPRQSAPGRQICNLRSRRSEPRATRRMGTRQACLP